MDLKMLGVGGVEATRTLRGRHPQVQVVALTSFAETELVQAAMQAGAVGYLLKDVSAADLAEAIRVAHAGRATLSSAAAQATIFVYTGLNLRVWGRYRRCAFLWPLVNGRSVLRCGWRWPAWGRGTA